MAKRWSIVTGSLIRHRGGYNNDIDTQEINWQFLKLSNGLNNTVILYIPGYISQRNETYFHR